MMPVNDLHATPTTPAISADSNDFAPSEDSRQKAHLVTYESLWRFIQMHDEHIYKIVSFYFVLLGVVVYNIDRLYGAPQVAAGFVMAVGVAVSGLLWRIAWLVSGLRNQLETAGENLGMTIKPLSGANYAKNKYVRTASLASYIVLIATLGIAINLFKEPNKDPKEYAVIVKYPEGAQSSNTSTTPVPTGNTSAKPTASPGP